MQDSPQMSDLEQAIKRQILLQTRGRVRQVEVEFIGKRVVIRGRAPSFYLKQLAIQGVLEALGHSVSNQIEIVVEVPCRPPRVEVEAK